MDSKPLINYLEKIQSSLRQNKQSVLHFAPLKMTMDRCKEYHAQANTTKLLFNVTEKIDLQTLSERVNLALAGREPPQQGTKLGP